MDIKDNPSLVPDSATGGNGGFEILSTYNGEGSEVPEGTPRILPQSAPARQEGAADAQRFSVSPADTGSAAELAASDAAKIDAALLRLFRPDASGSLLAASNREFMGAFLEKIGATGLQNADGTATAEAELRAQRALMTALFGNSPELQTIARALLERKSDLGLASLQRTLFKSAGALLSLKARAPSLAITDALRSAVTHYIEWRALQNVQTGLSFRQYFAQQANDMFSPAATELEKSLAALLEADRFDLVMQTYAALAVSGATLSIYAQLGLVMLIGLDAKNAILMVEYANEKRRDGLSIARSAIGGAKARFRAVMMTAWSFLVGVLPLVLSSGAGCESRQTIGLVTFCGLLVATIVGIAFPPAYFALFSRIRARNVGGDIVIPIG